MSDSNDLNDSSDSNDSRDSNDLSDSNDSSDSNDLSDSNDSSDSDNNNSKNFLPNEGPNDLAIDELLNKSKVPFTCKYEWAQKRNSESFAPEYSKYYQAKLEDVK